MNGLATRAEEIAGGEVEHVDAIIAETETIHRSSEENFGVAGQVSEVGQRVRDETIELKTIVEKLLKLVEGRRRELSSFKD
jgi:hypothetical protein